MYFNPFVAPIELAPSVSTMVDIAGYKLVAELPTQGTTTGIVLVVKPPAVLYVCE